jgi:hypothetical protein
MQTNNENRKITNKKTNKGAIMKKLTLVGAVAVLGLFGLNASAKLPSGYESVKVTGTILMQDGAKVKKVKVTTDDMLNLIDSEYDTSYSKADGGKGYQLVSYGVGDEEFAVLDKNGDVVLSDATGNEDNYYFYIYPYANENWAIVENGEKDTWTVPGVELLFRSDDEEDTFTIQGLMTDKVNYGPDDENYDIKFQGSVRLNDEDISGPISGSISGSGKDVDVLDD